MKYRRSRFLKIRVVDEFSELPQTDEAFNRIIFLALERVLGRNLNKALFTMLSRDHGITERNISENAEKFVSGLERVFGPTATTLLVISVSRVLAEEFGLKEDATKQNRSLSEVMAEVRKQLHEED